MHCISACHLHFRLGKVGRTLVPRCTWLLVCCCMSVRSSCQSRYVERRKRALVILVFVAVNVSKRNGLFYLAYSICPFMAGREPTRPLSPAFPSAILAINRCYHTCGGNTSTRYETRTLLMKVVGGGAVAVRYLTVNQLCENKGEWIVEIRSWTCIATDISDGNSKESVSVDVCSDELVRIIKC